MKNVQYTESVIQSKSYHHKSFAEQAKPSQVFQKEVDEEIDNLQIGI